MSKYRSGRTVDAVVVIPGIMGSELVNADGVVVWGLSPAVLAKAWTTRRLGALAVTDEELAGAPRLRPSRLLTVPAFMPLLGGLEPYGALMSRVRDTVLDPKAVLPFAYDWRLSVQHNAALLVTAAQQHLDAWRIAASQQHGVDPVDIDLVLVAHSMGGLVARYACRVLGLRQMTRQIITLGTPYFGAVNAMQMLATGHGAPVPRRAARELARTCPGVYDLLPRYRCVGSEPRLLTAPDVATVGGSAELAVAAQARWGRLALTKGDALAAPTEGVPPVAALVGGEQPTLQQVLFDGGAVTFEESLGGQDFGGDSTVYRRAASPPGVTAGVVPQKHGALAKTAEGLAFVADKLLDNDSGPPLGTRPIGMRVPDVITAGTPVEVTISGAGGDSVGVSVQTTDLDTQVSTAWTSVRSDGDLLHYLRAGLAPGLYRVSANAGGFSPVTEIILVEPAS